MSNIKSYSQIIGKRIIELCKICHNMPISELARRSDLDKTVINEIVNNKVATPNLATLTLIAFGFEMDLLTFLDIPELKNLTFEEAKEMKSRKIKKQQRKKEEDKKRDKSDGHD